MKNVERFRKRSDLRLLLGSKFYTFKRYIKWYFGNENYSKSYENKLLENCIFKHSTPLLRDLQNVELWMQQNKITNLKLATVKISNIVINPGETFSYWKLIGKPTKGKGYREGMVLSNGKISPGIGGGLCQLSNLIFWMTLHTPLTVVERYRHSHDYFPDSNRTQPFGSGATCCYNYIDLQIKNNTSHQYQLIIYMDDKYLYGEWRSNEKVLTTYQIYEKEHIITQAVWGDYIRHNSLYRKVFDENLKQIDDEFITENHAIMIYTPFLK